MYKGEDFIDVLGSPLATKHMSLAETAETLGSEHSCCVMA